MPKNLTIKRKKGSDKARRTRDLYGKFSQRSIRIQNEQQQGKQGDKKTESKDKK